MYKLREERVTFIQDTVHSTALYYCDRQSPTDPLYQPLIGPFILTTNPKQPCCLTLKCVSRRQKDMLRWAGYFIIIIIIIQSSVVLSGWVLPIGVRIYSLLHWWKVKDQKHLKPLLDWAKVVILKEGGGSQRKRGHKNVDEMNDGRTRDNEEHIWKILEGVFIESPKLFTEEATLKACRHFCPFFYIYIYKGLMSSLSLVSSVIPDWRALIHTVGALKMIPPTTRRDSIGPHCHWCHSHKTWELMSCNGQKTSPLWIKTCSSVGHVFVSVFPWATTSFQTDI